MFYEAVYPRSRIQNLVVFLYMTRAALKNPIHFETNCDNNKIMEHPIDCELSITTFYKYLSNLNVSHMIYIVLNVFMRV